MEINEKVLGPTAKAQRNKLNGGVLLIISAVVAVILANSPWQSLYTQFWNNEIVISFGNFHLFEQEGRPMTFLTFINDALMTIFFFSVGLEIKRELLVGELRSIKHALFPIFAAIGGMIFPILIYALLSPSGEAMRGMPIAMATDIAFSLGVLSLFSTRVPTSLKVFLTTLAVSDDIGGIIMIALFYSGHISFFYLLLAAVVWAVLFIGGYYFKIRSKTFYLVGGFIFWMLFVETGIHPTIAGVLVAFTIPARPLQRVSAFIEVIRENINQFPRRKIDDNLKIILSNDQISVLKKIETASDNVISPLQDIEDALHPIVNYFIMPLFALANAGVILGGTSGNEIVGGIALVVAASLIVGKFIGIFSFSYLANLLKIASAPTDVNWKQIAGIALLGGIGFTVSLFIANLSFGVMSPLLNQAKMGIVGGSTIAAILGCIWLNKVLPPKKKQ